MDTGSDLGYVQGSRLAPLPSTMPAMPHQVHAHDLRIETGRGALFTRMWWEGVSLQDAPPPIVLFHDSLGAVELWRSFPQACRRNRPAGDRL